MIDLSHGNRSSRTALGSRASVTVDTAVRQALEARAQAAGIAPEPPRNRSPEAVSMRRARMHRLAREIASLPILDPRSPREIVDDLNGP